MLPSVLWILGLCLLATLFTRNLPIIDLKLPTVDARLTIRYELRSIVTKLFISKMKFPTMFKVPYATIN
jgi:hypothetical protein